jgi:NTE family protein
MEWTGQADGVFRGGGVKGLGLAGALDAFATYEDDRKRVTKWVNVAGASAGAIIASYIACNRDVEDVGRKMLGLLDPEKMASFQDFPLGLKYLGGIPRLILRRGMAPGKAFEKWFDQELNGATFAVAKNTDDWTTSRLKLIACDVTNRRLLVLPEDLPKYRDPRTKEQLDPENVKISRAARMSMSIPYFFEPIQLELIQDDHGNPIHPPRPATIVDGGTLSNFPVWLFDSPNPQRPTFGFTLEGGSGVGAGINRLARLLPWAGRVAVDIFHTAQDAWDTRFATQSTTVRTLAVSATVKRKDGTLYKINTTDFKLSDEDKNLLVENGRETARNFLRDFELEKYINSIHASPQDGGGDAQPSVAAAHARNG